MKNTWKKAAAFALALAIVGGAAPADFGGLVRSDTGIVAYADDTVITEDWENGKNIGSGLTLGTDGGNLTINTGRLNCDQDSATITVKGTVTMNATDNYTCIYVPNGKTLTIQGDGTLILNASNAPAMGGSGAGSNYYACGNINIQGNVKVQANGGGRGAGIGSYNEGSCGTITISNTVKEVTATGGSYKRNNGSTAYCRNIGRASTSKNNSTVTTTGLTAVSGTVGSTGTVILTKLSDLVRAKSATCTEIGYEIDHYKGSNGNYYTRTTNNYGQTTYALAQARAVEIPALGHDWVKPEGTDFAWTRDNNGGYSCSVALECNRTGCTETTNVNGIVGEPTYTHNEENNTYSIAYTASFKKDNYEATDTKTLNLEKVDASEPGCETTGNYEYYKYTENNTAYYYTYDAASKAFVATTLNDVTRDSTGHSYGAPDANDFVWTKNGDGYTCTVTLECSNSGCTDTLPLTASEITDAITEQPTVNENGNRRYTATFEGYSFTSTHDEVINKITTGKTDYKAATCEEDGNIEYYTYTEDETVHYYTDNDGTLVPLTDRNEDNVVDIKDTVIDKLGHDYTGAEITYNCKVDEDNNYVFTASRPCQRGGCEHVDYSEPVTVSGSDIEAIEATTPPTVNEEGVRKYTVNFENDAFGEHEYELPIAKLVPESHAAVAPTCEEDGTIEYYTYGDKYYTKNDDGTYTEITAEGIVDPATGHEYSEVPKWEWNANHTKATAKFACTHNNCNDFKSVSTTNITVETVEPTYESAGSTTYKATVTFGGKPYETADIVTVDAVEPVSLSENSDCVITFEYMHIPYTGSAITPKFSVKVGSTVLKQGTDFTVESGGSEIGSADETTEHTLTIKGKGGYSGTASAKWYIDKVNEYTVTVTNGKVSNNKSTYKENEAVTVVGNTASGQWKAKQKDGTYKVVSNSRNYTFYIKENTELQWVATTTATSGVANMALADRIENSNDTQTIKVTATWSLPRNAKIVSAGTYRTITDYTGDDDATPTQEEMLSNGVFKKSTLKSTEGTFYYNINLSESIQNQNVYLMTYVKYTLSGKTYEINSTVERSAPNSDGGSDTSDVAIGV